jgi:hypothetical protein
MTLNKLDNIAARAGQQILVVYGVPPRMKLRDVAQREIGKTFSLTTSNRASFERALRFALTRFLGSDAQVMSARFIFIRNVREFTAAIRTGSYSQVVYYGHALDGENALLPARGGKIAPAELAYAFRGTTIRHFDILGCRSTSVAAELATLCPTLKIGHLRAAREDNVEVSPATLQVISLTIDQQMLFHFEPSRP